VRALRAVAAVVAWVRRAILRWLGVGVAVGTPGDWGGWLVAEALVQVQHHATAGRRHLIRPPDRDLSVDPGHRQYEARRQRAPLFRPKRVDDLGAGGVAVA
jgi:hypothetical protein